MAEQIQTPVSPEKPLNFSGDPLGLFDKSPEQSTPIPGGIRHTIPGLQSYNQAEAFKSTLANAPAYATDKFQYGKTYAYGADYTDQAFERYYSHAKFNKLGFSPYRNNEEVYNENSSAWNEFARAASYVPGLAVSTFAGPLRSYGDVLTGKPFKSDLKSAKEFDKAMSLGSSSRGGVSGFMSNLAIQSGFTFGLIGELIGEELVLAGATYLTGMATSEVTIPLMAKRVASTVARLDHFGDAVQGTWKGFKAIQTPEAAKNFYDAAKSTAKFLNPLEKTREYAAGYKAAKAAGTLTEFAKKNSAFGSFYRSIQEINFGLTESKMEGGSTQMDVNKNLTDEFYTKNGRMPNPEEAALISRTSQSAGYATVLTNLPVIYYSNKITFDNLFRGFAPLSRLDNTFIDKAGNRILHTTEKGKPAFQHIENSFKNSMKAFIQPKTYAKVGLNYFRANLSEGGQEVLQEVISGSAKDYYTSIYHDPKKAGIDSVIGNIADNFTKQVSGQGLETFMSGFLMGGMIGVVGKTANQVKDTAYKTFKSEQYKEYRAERDNYTKNVVQKLNDIYEDPLTYFAPDMVNFVAQAQNVEGMNDAMRQDNQKNFMDLKDTSVYGHIYTALRSDKYDILLDRLNSIKQMSPEAIAEAYHTDGQQVLASIDKIVKRAERIKQRFDKVNERFPNPFKPEDYKKGTPEYDDVANNYVSFEAAKGDAIMMSESYDKTSERMSSIFGDLTNHPGFKDLDSRDVTNLLDPIALQEEISLLKSEIDVYKGLTDSTAKKDLAKKQKKYDALKDYQDKLESHSKVQLNKVFKIEEEGPQKSKADTLGELYESFKTYINQLGIAKNKQTFDQDINSAFIKITDFYDLHKDADNLARAVNLLHSPEGMMEHFRRTRTFMLELWNQRKETIQAGQEAMMSVKEKNTLINNLFDKGFRISAEDLTQFLEDGTIPETFYYMDNKEIITVDSPKYKEIADILIKHDEAVKEPVVEITPEEIKANQEAENAGTKVKAADITSRTPWENLPTDLQHLLTDKFDLYFDDYKKKYEDWENASVTSLRQDWLTSQTAKDIIKTWKVAIETRTKSTASVNNIPKLITYTPIIELGVDSILGLKGVLGKLKQDLQVAIDTSLPIEDITTDIDNLSKYITQREGELFKRTDQVKLAEGLNKIINAQGDITKSQDNQFYIIKGDYYKRVTNVITPIEKLLTGKDDFSYPVEKLEPILRLYQGSNSVQEFMDKFKKMAPKEFNLRKYQALEDSLNQENSIENLESTINDLVYDESRTAGNTVDKIVRDFFVGQNTPEGRATYVPQRPEGIEPEPFVELIGELRRMLKQFDALGLTVMTDRIVVYDPINKVAGELDMLLQDTNGDVYIFDVKTSKASSWAAYNDLSNKRSNKIKHELQLSAYSNILHNNYGINVKGLGIIPFEVTYDLDGRILTVHHAKGVSQKETGIGGKIIYASPGVGKSTLAADSKKYVDGDELLLAYMVGHIEEFKKNPELKPEDKLKAQDAGKAFYTYINKSTTGEVEKKKLVDGIKAVFQASKKAGKTVLTSNWFAQNIADEIYTSQDVERMAKEFMAREQYKDIEEARQVARGVLAKEASAFAGKKVNNIPSNQYIGDIINAEPIRIKLEYNPAVEQAIPRGERKEPPAGSVVGGNVESLNDWYDLSKEHTTDTKEDKDAIAKSQELKKKADSLPDPYKFPEDSDERIAAISAIDIVNRERQGIEADIMQKRLARLKETPFYQTTVDAVNNLTKRINELAKKGGDVTGDWTPKTGVTEVEFNKLKDAQAILRQFHRGDIPTPEKIINALAVEQSLKETPAPVTEPGMVSAKEIEDMIASAKDSPALDKVWSEILNLYSEKRIDPATAVLAEQLVATRKTNFFSNLNIKDLAVGQILIDKNTKLGPIESRLLQVIALTDNTFTLRNFLNPKDTASIKKEGELSNYQRYTGDMTKFNQAPEVTKEEKDLTATVQTQNADFTSDTAAIKKISEETRDKDPKDVKKDFLNNLGCK